MIRAFLSRSLFCAVFVTTATSAAGPKIQKCIRANEDGQDRRREGRLREAEALFEFCSAPSCPSPLRGDCIVRLTETRRAVPSIVFLTSDARANKVEPTSVTMDGDPIAPRADDGSFHVDPGEHTFLLTARGYQPVSRTLVLHAGEARREEIVIFELSSPTDATSAGSAGVLGLSGDQQRVAAYAVGGVGVLGLGIGTYFGFLAKSTYDEASSPSNCPRGPSSCNDVGIAKSHQADDQATAATVAFSAGVVLLTTGIILFVLAPKRLAQVVADGRALRVAW